MRLKPKDLSFLHQVIADDGMMGFVTFEKASGQCVYINRLGRTLLDGFEDMDLAKINLSQLFPEEKSGHSRPLNQEIIAFEGLFQDVLVKKLSGQLLTGNVGVKHLTLAGYAHVLLMIQDISLQKKLQREIVAKQLEIKSAFEELLKQNKQLKELDLAKNRFVALTTHELRTPASAMLGSAEILQMGLYDSPEQMKEFIEIIYDQGKHLLELINDILDYAKIQSGKMDFFVGEHNVVNVMHAQIDQHQSLADHSHIKLSLQSTSDHIKCYFDDLRLKQVVSNMLSNAIKYNRQDGWVKVEVLDGDSDVTIRVRDSGHGIPESQWEQVFNEFETLGRVAQHHKGTGLGMPISKKLIEGMGGTIHLKSELNVGTTFWITIPKSKVLADNQYRPRPDDGGNLAA